MNVITLKSFLNISVILALVLNVNSEKAPKQEFITIGTGSTAGIYYAAGGAISKLVNRNYREHNIRSTVESTGGSVYNVNTIREGELQFGLVQSDWQHHGYKGTSRFAEQGPYTKLRAMFSLHTEQFNVVVRADSGFEKISDLRGRRVDIGNPGSGDRATMGVVMDAMGWTQASFRLASELRASERSQALCENKIDAYVYVAGHPNGAMKEATTSCDVKIISVSGAEIDKIVADHPYYAFTTLPAGMYSGTDKAVNSFGVTATLVTSSDVSDDVAYNVAKSVFENFTTFKRLHPAFANLKKEEMVSAGISIPLHPGAEKYYKEVGLLK